MVFQKYFTLFSWIQIVVAQIAFGTEDEDEYDEGMLHNFVLVLGNCSFEILLMWCGINILQGQNTWLKKSES